jgi:hypothetical protein
MILEKEERAVRREFNLVAGGNNPVVLLVERKLAVCHRCLVNWSQLRAYFIDSIKI